MEQIAIFIITNFLFIKLFAFTFKTSFSEKALVESSSHHVYTSYCTSKHSCGEKQRVKVLLFVKHNSPESSTNKARFRKFCKRLSIYLLFIRCVQEKQFC